MGRRLDGCLAFILWILTPTAQWIMEWLIGRKKRG